MKNRRRRKDPFENMPLRLMMLVEARPAALKNYRAMSDAERKRVESLAASEDRMGKERLIDSIEKGEF